MSIVTIARGSYSHGREVAERLAGRLGYECVSREVIIEAARQFNLPETLLLHGVTDAPSILERFTYGKEKYVACARAALLAHVRKGNVVYHGLAGHFFLRDVPTVMTVRIVADMQDRIAEAVRREDIGPEQARRRITDGDEQRRKWSLQIYGVDTWSSDNYDMTLNVDTMTIDDAVDLIFDNAQRPCFQTTPESQRMLDNLTLAARVQATLVEDFPTVTVCAQAGEVIISLEGPLGQQQKLTAAATDAALRVPGVEDALVHFAPLVTPD